jgi:hypothetical protein
VGHLGQGLNRLCKATDGISEMSGPRRYGHTITSGIAIELEDAYHLGALRVLRWVGVELTGEETHYVAGRAQAYGDAMEGALKTGREAPAAGKPMLPAGRKPPLLDFDRHLEGVYPSSEERLGHPIIRGIALELERAYLLGAFAALGWVSVELTEEETRYVKGRAKAYGDHMHDYLVSSRAPMPPSDDGVEWERRTEGDAAQA